MHGSAADGGTNPARARPDDARWMRRAIALAERASGLTSPNPPVGAVLVAGDRVVGEGWHRGVGRPHAEAEAIAAAGEAARGATAYVTLEPCDHTGRTPPCTEGLIAAGVRRVVYAVTDPNPIASGGAGRLRAAGVEVVGGVEEAAARRLARFFLHHVETGRPWVIAKSASSLDGRVATRTGHSKWITGDAARREGHRLRQAVDAILVGIGTALADDPSLDVRLPEGSRAASGPRHPRPIVLDTDARLPTAARLLAGEVERARPLLVVGERADRARCEALAAAGAEILALPLERLGASGVQSLLVEGGPTVHGRFADARLIDEVALFLAPTLIGGADAPAAFGGLGATTLDGALALEEVTASAVGADIMVRGFVRRASASVLAPRLARATHPPEELTSRERPASERPASARSAPRDDGSGDAATRAA